LSGRTASGHPYWTTIAPSATHWLVLTHGAFLDHQDSEGIAEGLRGRFNVVTWDLPGHGLSENPPAHRLDELATALAEVMDAARVDRAIQLGFSFGGMIAQAFARRFPQRTDVLVCYGCVPITMMPPAPPAAELWPVVLEALRATPWDTFCRKFAEQASIDFAQSEGLYRRVVAQPPALRDAIWEAMVLGGSHEPDFWFACPVGHIMGARDDRFPGAHELMEAFAARLPVARSVRVEDAGHVAHLERPAAFAAALGALFAALEDQHA
jgi:pimeloyl-ACP methyl ester carboxylesterase